MRKDPMTPPPKITAEMSVPEIVAQFPETAPVFLKYGLKPDYKALQYENLSASVLVNQIQLERILAELNQVAR